MILSRIQTVHHNSRYSTPSNSVHCQSKTSLHSFPKTVAPSKIVLRHVLGARLGDISDGLFAGSISPEIDEKYPLLV